MDSGNSGSMQSSSGGDEEYDSRAATISAMFNSSAQMTNILNPSQTSGHHPPMFDPIPTTYLDNFSTSVPSPPLHMNSLLNLDMGWARAPRSDVDCTDMATGLFRSPPSSTSPAMISGLQQYSNLTNNPCNYMNPPSGSDNGARPSPSGSESAAPRSSKKRSRASRRAPTTVLTTDTTNFRAMVQEFTGIPAPPFSGSSFPRSRLDFFATGSALRSGQTDPSPPPPYLLRPSFVQKPLTTRVPRVPSFISFPLSSSPSSSPAPPSPSTTTSMLNVASSSANSISMSSSNPSTRTINAPNLASTSNYQLPSSDLGLPKHQTNILNVQNPTFSFQSLLQSSPAKYPSSGLSGFVGKDQGTMDLQARMGTLEGFSMNDQGHNHHHRHGGGGTLANLISAGDPPNWVDGVGSSGGDHDEGGGQLRNFDGDFSSSSQRVIGSCKLNYNSASSSSDFQVEKVPENSRGDGMVDSWICSSD